MAGESGKKISSFHRFGWLNIGTLLFGAIFLYMVITVFMYLTASHITSYEVTLGSISGNYRYTALALKSETVETAQYGGYVTYYARSGTKVSVGTVICSVDENPVQAAEDREAVALSAEHYKQLREMLSSFSLSFSDSAYQDVYNCKADIESYLIQLEQGDDITYGAYNQISAPVSGFVSYTIDGLETVTQETLTRDMFNRSLYSADNLRLHSQVRMGDPLFKLVTGEEWYLYFPISQSLATELNGRTAVRFRFLRDATTFTAKFDTIELDGSYYGKITLRNSLVRYVSDRYLEIELLMDSKVGLKIPASSISEKEFWKIPSDYVIVNEDDGNEITLIRQTFRSDGTPQTDYVTATVYDRQDGSYLVAKELFSPGDFVQMDQTSKKHQIVEDDLAVIQGVFNINKGFAVFRQVNLIDENEEFCVVEPYNQFGLAAHDYIAMDASSVEDNDIVY